MSIWRLMYNLRPFMLRAGTWEEVAGVRKSGPLTSSETVDFGIAQLTCPTHPPTSETRSSGEVWVR